MRALLPLLLFAAPAFAAGELQIQSSSPVIVVLDGQTLGTIQPLEPLLVDIEPGVHNLRIQGLLGKQLYDRDLIFEDNTRTELHWQSKELRLGQIVKLDPNRAPPPSAEPPAPPAAEDLPLAIGAGDGGRRSRESSPPAEAPPAPPAPVAAAPPAPPPAAAAPRAPEPVAAKTSPDAARAPSPSVRGVGALTIEATENLDLQIVHGGQTLRVRVVNGDLVVEDRAGTQVHFPSTGGAW